MKRSVENAEQVGMQLLKINHNDKTLTLLDLGLFTPTAGQYFRDEQRRRHSQILLPAQWPEIQRDERTRVLPGGQPYCGWRSEPGHGHLARAAKSQNFHNLANIMLCDNSTNLRTTFLIIFPDTLGDSSSPIHWVTGRPKRAALKNHRGSKDSTTSSTLASSSPDVMCEPQSGFRTFPNKDGQPPSAQIVSVSLSGGPIVCFDSGWPELFGDFVARRSVYGADMLPHTTDFGVTPEEARALHKKQQVEDAAKDAAVQSGGGIWDGSAPKNKTI
ncbi:mei2-like protein [Fusarium bulbicola]|nr:mei2-like protein [Fusarium bulbicola]